MFNWLKNRGRLQAKVLYTMLVTAVVPLVVLGVSAIYILDYFHKLDVQAIERTLLDETSSQIDAAISRYMETFQVQVTYNQTTDVSLQDQKLILDQMLVQFPELTEVSFISVAEGNYGRETSVIVNNGSGEFLDRSELTDQSKLPKFIEAAAGRNYIGPVYYTQKGPMVTIAAPVKNTPTEEGVKPAVISVLTGEIRLSTLPKLINVSRLGNTGYLYLQDENGFLLAQSRGGGLKAGTPLKIRNNPELERYTSFGEPVVGMNRQLSTIKGRLVAEWPVSDADQVVNTVERQTIFAVILVLLGTLFIGFFLALRIVKPIKVLEAGVADIEKGEFDRKVIIDSHDELQDLGEAFNRMALGLKRLQDLKNEFVFVAAHELRAPVTVIKGYLSMIMGGDAGPIEPQLKSMLDPVDQANKNLQKLVEDLLAVARSDSGKIEIKVKPMDVTEIFDQVLTQFKPAAKEKDIELLYDKTQLPAVLGDPDKVKEIAMNLVSNSVKYTLGSGKVRVSHEIKDGLLVTHVKDQGIGISAENQKKLFEKFYRIKSPGTEEIPGTGLGLWIVKELLEKMHGWITVASEGDATRESIPKERQGTTFSFALPLSDK
ncbi:MAG: ATP-binding protein [Candidatus Saccharibacteria bacterium]